MNRESVVPETDEHTARSDTKRPRSPGRCLLVPAILLVQYGCGDPEHQYGRVERGRFRSTLTETGELQAVRYTIVPMPHFNWRYGRPRITDLEPEGTLVKKGDLVGNIEASGVVREIGRKEADLAIGRADLNKMRVQHASKVKELEGKIRTAESSLRMAAIDEQRVSFESETQKKIKASDKRIKQLTLKRLREKLETVKLVQEEDLKIHRARIRKIESAVDRARLTLERFVLKAPAEGLIEYRQNRRTRQKVAAGDQLRPGTPIVGLPDLSRMKARTWVSETDITKVTLKQEVRLRLDAFPKFVFAGHITEISRIGRRKDKNDKSKVFAVEVLLQESDPLLRPGMTVSCEFLVADLDDALFVQSDCIHSDNGEFVLYVRRGWGIKRVPVSLGPRSNRTVVISGDVSAGDRVVRSVREGST